MTDWFSVPSEFVDGNTKPTVQPRLLPEIENWCLAEVGPYEVRWRSQATRRELSKPWEIGFENFKDAIFFKLRWFG